MAIKIRWKNKNTPVATIEIYRGAAPLDTANPGTPIATLPGSATGYDDSDVSLGGVYYYTIAVRYNGVVVFSTSKLYSYTGQRGPGPQSLIYGDESLGYYGSFPMSEFYFPVRFWPTLFTDTNHKDRTYYVHKFIRRGKIVYTYDSSILNLAYLSNLNGVSINGGMTWAFNNSNVGPDVIKQFDGYVFRPRAIRVLPDEWDGTSVSADLQSLILGDTEFNSFMPSIYGNFDRFARMPIMKAPSGINKTIPNQGRVFGAEKVSVGGPWISVGPLSGQQAYGSTGVMTQANTHGFALTSDGALQSNNISFFPVIELVEV